GLVSGQTYEAKLMLAVNNIEEMFEIPMSLRVWGENVEEILSNNYNIYPNPTTSLVTIEGENINYVAVYNSVGQLIKVVKTQNNVVDMSACENGVYFFNIVDNAGQSSVQRVVVAK
ncbi:MAG: T9SS type A sorting domain-containing protein, partial [Bacteroidales bacterium]|nr:T9SS type A sorting domain-containing protein [Bacteroidales bacterium]